MTKILIVEDQFIEGNNLRLITQKAGYWVYPIVRSVDEALELLRSERPDMVLLDIYLGGIRTGIDLAKILGEQNIPFCFISANSNHQTLDAAKVTNPYGFLVKPFREQDVMAMLEVALYVHQQRSGFSAEHTRYHNRRKLPVAEEFQMVGNSPAFTNVLTQMQLVAPSDTSVLILGESGTGKELIAHALHRNSPRRDKPFVIVNCAALPATLIESELFGHEKGSFTGATEKRTGKFEQADGGTVFLDEIGELSLDLQVKFLRVLQERAVEPIGGVKKKMNVRVIAATNKNLEEEIASGRFRMDLYYRLNVFPILLPALREREEDILPLAANFISRFAARENKRIAGLSDEAAAKLVKYRWPGNIRELENIMERCVLLTSGRLITEINLPAIRQSIINSAESGTLKTIDQNERDHIIAALERCDWKIYGPGGAAELLDINAATLHSRMKKLGIEKQVSHKKR